MTPNIVKMIAVHYANKSGRGQAALFVPYSTAVEMVEARLAVWSKGAKYLNLTKSEACIAPSQPSCRMGEGIVFANACGDSAAMALVASWQPKISFAPHQLAA